MGITYGDHLIDSGHYDITPEQEREIEAREECARRGLDPDDDAADGVAVWMIADQEMRERALSSRSSCCDTTASVRCLDCPRTVISEEERVAGAIMRAFFSRPLDLQYINVSVDDQADLARAAIEAIEASRVSGDRKTPSPWDSTIYQKLRAMPSSLNDACRTMQAAADEIDRLYEERRALTVPE